MLKALAAPRFAPFWTLATLAGVALQIALAAGVPASHHHGQAGRCLSGPSPAGIYHPYNRAGNGAWRGTLAFLPRCYR